MDACFGHKHSAQITNRHDMIPSECIIGHNNLQRCKYPSIKAAHPPLPYQSPVSKATYWHMCQQTLDFFQESISRASSVISHGKCIGVTGMAHFTFHLPGPSLCDYFICQFLEMRRLCSKRRCRDHGQYIPSLGSIVIVSVIVFLWKTK